MRLVTSNGNTLQNGLTVTLSARGWGDAGSGCDVWRLRETSRLCRIGATARPTAHSSLLPRPTTSWKVRSWRYDPVGEYAQWSSHLYGQFVTITDADIATVSFQSAGTTVGEDGGAANLVLVLTTAPGDTLESNATFTVTATNGSASNADYDAIAFPKTVTFTAGQGNSSTQTVNFTPSSDTLVEGNETVTLAIANGTLLTGSGQTNNLVTIQDADSATVSFQSASTNVGEDAGTASLVLVLSTAPGNTLQSSARSLSRLPMGRPATPTTMRLPFPGTVTFTAGQGNSSTQTVRLHSQQRHAGGRERRRSRWQIANGTLLTGSGQTNNLVTIQDADSTQSPSSRPAPTGRRRCGTVQPGAGAVHGARQYAAE